MSEPKFETYHYVAETSAIIPHGEDDHASLAVDLLNAGVPTGSPTDNTEVRAITTLLHVDSALEGPIVDDVIVFDALIAKVTRGGRFWKCRWLKTTRIRC